jgi:myo-inositol-1(or 4)-monophosphatase
VRELLLELGLALRRHLLPSLGSHAGRSRFQTGAGGDITFSIDQQAEIFLERFLAERAPELAFYSEDRGLVLPGPEAEPSELPEFPAKEIPAFSRGFVLVVDPIDGTRPAMAGLESCCVSIAAADLRGGRATMGDVRAGCIVEIKSGALFVAERGKGVELRDAGGGLFQARLSENTDITRFFWSAGFRGRPAGPLVTMLGELIDASSVRGAFFDLGSATFDMTRILTGQLDAYVDVGTRMIDEVPKLRESFEEVGGGAVLNNSPYDLAAAVLCLEEGGAVVTDAYGERLDRRPLLGSGHEFQMSCLSAANGSLHSKLLSAIERGVDRLRAS